METLVGKDLYTQLSILLEYPREDFTSRIDVAINIVGSLTDYPQEVINGVREFKKAIEDMPLDDIQGVYSYTFEMSADTTLDMGAHIYDGFKRAENLVHIKAMYRRFEFPFETYVKGELPDNLPLILRFLGFAKDEEVKKDFKRDFLIKALEKLNKNFSKNQDNPYYHIINAVYRLIDRDVKEVK